MHIRISYRMHIYLIMYMSVVEEYLRRMRISIRKYWLHNINNIVFSMCTRRTRSTCDFYGTFCFTSREYRHENNAWCMLGSLHCLSSHRDGFIHRDVDPTKTTDGTYSLQMLYSRFYFLKSWTFETRIRHF